MVVLRGKEWGSEAHIVMTKHFSLTHQDSHWIQDEEESVPVQYRHLYICNVHMYYLDIAKY